MRVLLFFISSLIITLIQGRELLVKRAVPIIPNGELNNNPIIGVLTQRVSNLVTKNYGDEYRSYIAASYVKFVEGAGARVVPIWVNQPREYYKDILSKLNGVLLPGGATYFNDTKGYAEAGAYIYDIAIEMNKNNIYFPIWGTCLGFELLLYLSANGQEHRAHCNSLNQPLPLVFKNDFLKSRLFQNTPEDIIQILKTEPVTANFHQFCFTEKNLTDYNLDKDWKVLSVNYDWNGFEFISSIEHNIYPFFGVQFHPEKNIYEWAKKNITHTLNAIRSSQYFAEFFINEARKNPNHFINGQEEMDSLIYNYVPIFTGKKGSAFVQMYLFKDQINYNNRYDGIEYVHENRSSESAPTIINLIQ